jgi:hypothetical protein
MWSRLDTFPLQRRDRNVPVVRLHSLTRQCGLYDQCRNRQVLRILGRRIEAETLVETGRRRPQVLANRLAFPAAFSE